MGLRILTWDDFKKYALRYKTGRADILVDHAADMVILRRVVESKSIETAVTLNPNPEKVRELQAIFPVDHWFEPVVWYARADEFKRPGRIEKNME
jgi:hypothetical protein